MAYFDSVHKSTKDFFKRVSFPCVVPCLHVRQPVLHKSAAATFASCPHSLLKLILLQNFSRDNKVELSAKADNGVVRILCLVRLAELGQESTAQLSVCLHACYAKFRYSSRRSFKCRLWQL
jgi:hypothetical protein